MVSSELGGSREKHVCAKMDVLSTHCRAFAGGVLHCRAFAEEISTVELFSGYFHCKEFAMGIIQ